MCGRRAGALHCAGDVQLLGASRARRVDRTLPKRRHRRAVSATSHALRPDGHTSDAAHRVGD